MPNLEAPWITETMRAGHCSSGYWNSPQLEDDALVCDRCRGYIYLGDEYYDFDGATLCEECFDIVTRKARKTHGI